MFDGNYWTYDCFRSFLFDLHMVHLKDVWLYHKIVPFQSSPGVFHFRGEQTA